MDGSMDFVIVVLFMSFDDYIWEYEWATSL